jgi:hypothetical protein
MREVLWVAWCVHCQQMALAMFVVALMQIDCRSRQIMQHRDVIKACVFSCSCCYNVSTNHETEMQQQDVTVVQVDRRSIERMTLSGVDCSFGGRKCISQPFLLCCTLFRCLLRTSDSSMLNMVAKNKETQTQT